MMEIVKSGIHFVEKPVEVASGTKLIAEKGARLVGGIRLTAEYAGDGVYVCDIVPNDFQSRGFGRPIVPSHSELFIDGKPMNISRYPKTDFLKITAAGEYTSNEWSKPVGKLEGGFFYEDEHPKTWKKQHLWTFGYWAYDWSPTRERVDVLDAERGFVKNAPPYGQYSYIIGQRFCFFNIIEEVTEYGDYAIDFDNGKLYFKPFADTDMKTAEIFLSVSDKPVFVLDGVKDVEIDGFTIEVLRGNGIVVNNSENVRIRNCEIRNIGNRGVVVDRSVNVIVENCHIHHTGDAGVAMWCGDRKTLTPSGCGVENCHIHHVATWDRCYEPPIKLTGVGLHAVGNVLHDCPHTAILYGGNDITIDSNEIYRVVLETGDAGAIYAGRDYTMRGNVVSRNFIHHVGSGIGMGTMGVYNDDCLSGTVMLENVFYKVQRALFLGGGVDFECTCNVFIDCTPSIEIDGRGQSDHKVWRNMIVHTMRDRFYNVDGKGVSAAESPYIDRYPELAKIDAYYRSEPEPHIPPSAVIRGNIFCSEQKIKYTWNSEGGSYVEENNIDVDRNELRAYLTQHQLEVIDAER